MKIQQQSVIPVFAGDLNRTGLDKTSIKHTFLDHLFFLQGKFPSIATFNDYYMALSYVIRDRLLYRWINTAATYTREGSRTVAYLSAEFLMGPHLGNNLVNMGITSPTRDAMKELGLNLEKMLGQEEEPGLGNGGLGRLAACYLDSLAMLEMPALGYGIRYEYGIFHQVIRNGRQVELTDKWLRNGNPREITERTLAFTNHTLLPEALECWSLPLFKKLLPRHLEIIYEINACFLDRVRIWCMGDPDTVARMSIIGEEGERTVRMAHLACVGSHSIDGVAGLHTELLKTSVLKDFHDLSPAKFSNKTNGVTPRRWIMLSNPRLAALLDDTLGAGWAKDLETLRQLEPLAEDADFRARWRDLKRHNKLDVAHHLRKCTGVAADPDSLFDMQVKRIHEYKRQHLNILHIIALYNRIRQNPDACMQARTFIFAGKSAPGYQLAKLIIQLITAVASIVNRDPLVRGRLKIVFLPNFNVSNGQRIYPAADLSEQISTAGKEASGTGNMKYSMNGALTIGTLDGANIKIRDAVGKENFFLFGHTADEIKTLQQQQRHPAGFIDCNEELQEVLQLIRSGLFSRGDPALFQSLLDSLMYNDPFWVRADFAAYSSCQQQVSKIFQDKERWAKMSILNTARMGWFSSDRSIREYCDDIWKLSPVKVKLQGSDGIGFLQSLQ